AVGEMEEHVLHGLEAQLLERQRHAGPDTFDELQRRREPIRETSRGRGGSGRGVWHEFYYRRTGSLPTISSRFRSTSDSFSITLPSLPTHAGSVRQCRRTMSRVSVSSSRRKRSRS